MLTPAGQRPWSATKALKQHQGSVPSGSLIVSDVFRESDPDDQASHGGAVVAAARSLQFSGPVFFQQAVAEPVPEMKQGMAATQLLATPQSSVESLDRALEMFAVGPPIHMLVSGTEEVKAAHQSEASGSVLNLSSGVCQAQVANMLYRLTESDNGEAVTKNYARLFALDLDCLHHPDPAQSAAAKHSLAQALVEKVSAAWKNDSRLDDLRTDFQTAVQAFESRGNSVVIAAGNEGLIKPILEQAGGQPLSVPSDFEQNVLEVPEVTSVGATIILDGVEAPARYSSSGQGVDLYASGDKVMGQEFDSSQGLTGVGTSIAAPRVAAVMAALHRDHPELDSQQIEELLARELATGPMALLDASRAQALLLRSQY